MEQQFLYCIQFKSISQMGEQAIWILFKFEMLMDFVLYFPNFSPILLTTLWMVLLLPPAQLNNEVFTTLHFFIYKFSTVRANVFFMWELLRYLLAFYLLDSSCQILHTLLTENISCTNTHMYVCRYVLILCVCLSTTKL